jgi:hypothetical protein
VCMDECFRDFAAQKRMQLNYLIITLLLITLIDSFCFLREGEREEKTSTAFLFSIFCPVGVHYYVTGLTFI